MTDGYQRGLFAVINPSLSGKIGGLSTVESMVEAGVIAEWEGDDELAGFLRHLDRDKSPAAKNMLLSSAQTHAGLQTSSPPQIHTIKADRSPQGASITPQT